MKSSRFGQIKNHPNVCANKHKYLFSLIFSEAQWDMMRCVALESQKLIAHTREECGWWWVKTHVMLWGSELRLVSIQFTTDISAASVTCECDSGGGWFCPHRYLNISKYIYNHIYTVNVEECGRRMAVFTLGSRSAGIVTLLTCIIVTSSLPNVRWVKIRNEM